ncbi:hypothetical protein PoB_001747700 [Plakobranchus ocellatus]|uniref:THAP-type domain-containing protein n=1 Tax=Plakobranchus ocellatus TaxID=259542 RepID=A0AAV3Z918_9GAST|nr:hypothetical protein PoB_001747700 [Plakobranchus ocellatus]
MAAPAKCFSNSSEWCSAINCTNTRNKNPRMSFFKFPKDPERNKVIHCAVPTVFDIPNKPPSVTPRRPSPKKRCMPISSVHFIAEEPIHTEKPQSAQPVRELTP